MPNMPRHDCMPVEVFLLNDMNLMCRVTPHAKFFYHVVWVAARTVVSCP